VKQLIIFSLTTLIILSFFSATSSADLIFQMTATDNTLSVGQEATIGIWAYAEEAAGLNGLNGWQLDLVTDVDNVVAVKTDSGGDALITLIAPAPYHPDDSGWTSINNPNTGNVYGLKMGTNGSQDSGTAVGDYSLLAEIKIEGVAEGTVTYNMNNLGIGEFIGWLRDGNYYDIDMGNVSFDSSNGENVFMVSPEPSSLLMLSLMSITGLRRKRQK